MSSRLLMGGDIPSHTQSGSIGVFQLVDEQLWYDDSTNRLYT